MRLNLVKFIVFANIFLIHVRTRSRLKSMNAPEVSVWLSPHGNPGYTTKMHHCVVVVAYFVPTHTLVNIYAIYHWISLNILRKKYLEMSRVYLHNRINETTCNGSHRGSHFPQESNSTHRFSAEINSKSMHTNWKSVSRTDFLWKKWASVASVHVNMIGILYLMNPWLKTEKAFKGFLAVQSLGKEIFL